ncbi:MAG: aminotransferase class IV [Nitrospinota bacterium]|nr:aminotransferase class IV [Nitrospinota bacterium]
MSGTYSIVNGELRLVDDHSVNVKDRSFSLGDGLFETVKVKNYMPVWISEHLKRMENSAHFARIGYPGKNRMIKHIDTLIESNGIKNGFLRITLSRGTSEKGSFGDIPLDCTFAIIGSESETPADPLKAKFAPWPSNADDPAVKHKTTSRFSNVHAWMKGKEQGMDELLFVNTRDELAEGVFSNIFFAKGKTLCTPSLECGILPGITREKIIDLARRMQIEVSEGAFRKSDILDADEIFFTNSLSLVRYCAEFEGKELGEGKFAKSLKRDLASIL